MRAAPTLRAVDRDLAIARRSEAHTQGTPQIKRSLRYLRILQARLSDRSSAFGIHHPCCGGYRHYGRAASYSPGRPWSLDGAALANKVYESLNANRNPAFLVSPSLFWERKLEGVSPDLKFREVSKLSPFGCVGLTGSEDRESGH